MSSFRPTLIERAYQLAEDGDCATPGDVKRRLVEEGFPGTNVQTHLYGSSITQDLIKRCRAHYRAPELSPVNDRSDVEASSK